MLLADVPRANGYLVRACKCGLGRSAGTMAMVQFGLYINSPKGLRSLAVRDGQAMNSHSATTQLPCPLYSVWVRRGIEALFFAQAVRHVCICPLGDLICFHHSHDWRLQPLLRPLAVPISSVFTQPFLHKNSHPRSLTLSCGFICAGRKHCST